MRDIRAALLAILLALLAVSGVSAQDSIIAPNIFVRGMQLPQGVRYSAAFVKPSDDTILRNISVEVTLPGDAAFVEMLVSRQIEFDVIRRSPQKQLTLIWQISRISADQPLDSFSFTVAQPLSDAVEFYMQWQDENGVQHVENFFEWPVIIDATQSEQTLTLTQTGMQMLGATGIQIVPPAHALPLSLTARVLSTDFNPPPQYGDLWWCSLLDLEGLAVGTSAEVIVPLRRPVAPFTALAMFQQQADGTWLPLTTQAIVTADGQYAQYVHPGGLVATGGPEEIQQTPLSAEQVVIVDVATIPDPAPVIEAPVEAIQVPIEPVQPPIEPTAMPIEPTQAPVVPTQAPIQPTQPPQSLPTTAPVADGTSNTILVGERSPTPNLTPSPVTPIATAKGGAIIVGGTSSLPTPALLPTLNSNQPTVSPTSLSGLSGIADGTSNTILVGERTPTLLPNLENTLPTPTLRPDGGVLILPTSTRSPGLSGIADGTSNTILVGERTPTLLPNLENSLLTPTLRPDGAVVILPTSTRSPGLSDIADGTSNTIFVGERPTLSPIAPIATSGATATPPLIVTSKGNGVTTVGLTPTLLPTLSSSFPTPTLARVTDGTSNTLIIGEPRPTINPTLSPIPLTATRIPPTPTIAPTTVLLSPGIIVNPPPITNPILPFGGGGARVEILAVSNTSMTQCSAKSVNCAVVVRIVGKGQR